MTLTRGQKISSYEILGPLGAGGMGEVYQARDLRLGREVAIKVLPEQFVEDAERLLRFEREAKVLASLNHENIAALHAIEHDGSTCFLALEYVSGETLAERLRHGPLPITDALDICRQIARGLEAAHEAGVIHRDLKPSNIRITEDGMVKILDFGLAKPSGTGSGDSTTTGSQPNFDLTREGEILGTPAYMSPEQARGKKLDRRTDIWSFGCVLFECLTGKRTFTGESLFDILVSVVEDEPDWEALPSNLAPTVRQIAARCLEKSSRRRLRDIGEATLVLEDALEGREPTGLPVEPSHRRKMHPAWVVGAVAVIGLTIAAGWMLRDDIGDPQLRKFEIVPKDAGWGVRLYPVVSPDGSRIAYQSGGSLWIRDLSRLEPFELVGAEGGEQPCWSPDGQWIAYARELEVWKIRADGGEPIAIGSLPEALHEAGGIAWLRDSRIVATTGTSGLLQVPAEGGEFTELVSLDLQTERDFHDPAATIDGNGALFVVHHRSRDYRSIDSLIEGTRRTLLKVDGQFLSETATSPSGHLLYARTLANPGIWSVPFDSSWSRTLAEPFRITATGIRPSVSRDGTLVYEELPATRTRRLVWLDREGQVSESLGEFRPVIRGLALSPDGSQILLSEMRNDGSDVWHYDLEQRSLTRLTSGGGHKFAGGWFPDGKRYVFIITSMEDSSFESFTSKVTGSEEPRPLVQAAASAISSDGRYVVYCKGAASPNPDAWILSLDDGQARPILDTPSREEHLTLSPDDRLLAFVSNSTGRNEVYLVPFPEGGAPRRVSMEGGGHASFGFRSDRLYFLAPGNELMEVELSAEPPFVMGKPSRLFSGAELGVDFAFGFDPDPSSDRFLVLQDAEYRQHLPRIVVVENWAEEYRD